MHRHEELDKAAYDLSDTVLLAQVLIALHAHGYHGHGAR
jgi:hypothetical protein